MSFLDFGFIDLLDIVVVAYLFYKLYNLIKGTIAINIFTVIAIIYLIWTIVKAMNMQLLSTILGQFIGVGVLAIIIVFQQEIRRFFLLIYSEYLANINLSIESIFSRYIKTPPQVKVYSITKACINMAKTKTGALIVISRSSKLESYTSTGIILNADTTSNLLETIFFKNSPLHDGAVIIVRDKIIAGSCILPVSESQSLPSHYGLRHRSALGISEATNALTVVVSEETGEISYFKNGYYFSDIKGPQLRKILEKEYAQKDVELDVDDKEFESKPVRKIDLNPFKN